MKHGSWVLGLLLLAGVCHAQTFEDQEHALRDSLVKKTLCLRSFSAENEVDYVWTGTSLEATEPAVRTFGAMKITGVKVTRDKVEIDGVRRTLLRKKDQSLVWEGMDSPVKMIVTLRGADPSTLSRLPDLLFYPSEEKATDDIPEEFRPYVPAPYEMSRFYDQGPIYGKTPPCDCANNDATFCGREPKSPGWVLPKEQGKFVVPSIPTEAKVSMKPVIIGAYIFRVDETGHVGDAWIAFPAGFGVDEASLRQISRMPYKPATCHDKPVAAISSFMVTLHLRFPTIH